MPRLDDIPKGEAVIALIYGATGVGKTEFCGTAGSRSLIINTGLGIETLHAKNGFKKRHPGVNPIIETVYEDFLPDKALAHDKVCDIIDAYLDPKHPEYNNIDTIIVDDATALKRFAQNRALEVNDDLQKSQSLKESKKKKTMVMAVQDYGMEMSIIDQFLCDHIMMCREHHKNFILTAHERVEYNKPSSIGGVPTVRMVRPGFTGQTFPDSVTGHFDLVWRMEMIGGGQSIIRNARTVGDSSLVAKTRQDGLFPILVKDPNFLDVVKKIRES